MRLETYLCNLLVDSRLLQGESGGLGLGYVDINSVSFGGYPDTELSQHNPVRDHQNHPVLHHVYLNHINFKFLPSVQR